MTADAVDFIVDQWGAVRGDLDATPLHVIGRLHRLAHTIDGRLHPLFADAGLGDGDFDLLAALRRAGPPFALSAGELAKAMLVTSGATTKRIDRLQRRGLVARHVAPEDGRGRRVSLTADGLELVDRLMAAHLDNQRALLAGLTEPQLHNLTALLRKLLLSLDR